VDTLRSLEEALQTYTGCAVIVSHDRYFLDRLCTHILVFGAGVRRDGVLRCVLVLPAAGHAMNE
jgi:ATPase subunit of ABC transporter with duplicated ATPase domains